MGRGGEGRKWKTIALSSCKEKRAREANDPNKTTQYKLMIVLVVGCTRVFSNCNIALLLAHLLNESSLGWTARPSWSDGDLFEIKKCHYMLKENVNVLSILCVWCVLVLFVYICSCCSFLLLFRYSALLIIESIFLLTLTQQDFTCFLNLTGQQCILTICCQLTHFCCWQFQQHTSDLTSQLWVLIN